MFFFYLSRSETRAQPFPIQKWSNPIGRPECVPETVEHFRCYERFSRAVGFCFFIVRPIFIFLFFYQSEEICFRFCPKCVPEIMERSLFYFPLNQFLSCFRIDLLSQSGKKKINKKSNHYLNHLYINECSRNHGTLFYFPNVGDWLNCFLQPISFLFQDWFIESNWLKLNQELNSSS